MKKLIYIFLLLPFLSIGQTANGTETKQNAFRSLSPQTVATPVNLATMGTDGTIGKTPESNYTRSSRTININGVAQDLSTNRDWQTGYADTGVLTFAGMTPNSSTTINIGACKGWIIDNETNPLAPTKTYVDYPGATNVTVPSVGSAIGSYVLLNSSGITFITTQPTPAQRKAYIYLGKVGHPAGAITVVANTPDNILSPLGQVRALYNALDFINEGVSVAPNGANLNVNLNAGYITGSGINFVTDDTSPNRLTVNPQTPASFIIRTQTGAGGGSTTTVTPGNYDVGGVVTAVPGGSNSATIQYVFYAPGAGVFFQLGQNVYPSLTDAVAAANSESFVIYPNFVDNVILIGQLVVTKSATDLSNTSQARFLKASKIGEIGGSNSGISTATLQSAYNNSLVPQITTSTLGAVTVRRGSASDSDNVIAVQNGAGTNTFSVNGNGDVTGNINHNTLTNLQTAQTGVTYGHITDGAQTIVGNKTFSNDHVINGFISGSFSRVLPIGNTSIGQTINVTGTDNTSAVLGGTAINYDEDGFVRAGTNLPNVFRATNNKSTNQPGLNIFPLRGEFTQNGTGSLNIVTALAASLSGTGTGSIATSSFLRCSMSGGFFNYNINNFYGIDLSTMPNITGGGVTNSRAIFIGDVYGSTLARGIDLNVSSGTGKHNIYSAGSAPNYFNGNLLIGTTVSNGNAFRLTGTAELITTPTTSAGTYDIITRNTSTGVVEKIPITTFATTASPTFTGTPTAPTATAGTNTTQIATTAFVQTATGGYKKYVALVSQSGTSAPTVTVLENTFGGTVVWTRAATGNYHGTLTGVYTLDKTTAQITGNFSNVLTSAYRVSSDVVAFQTTSSGTAVDSGVTNATLEIRVYP